MIHHRAARLRLLLVLAGVVALTVTPAGPAHAKAPSFNGETPKGLPARTANPISIAVNVSMKARETADADGYLRGPITLRLNAVDITGNPTMPDPYTEQGADRAEATVTWKPSLTFPYNGEYRVTAKAFGVDRTDPPTAAPEEATHSWSFFVAVPPEVPTGVSALANGETRKATVSWKANPEPDVLYYGVLRTYGKGEPEAVGAVTAVHGDDAPSTYKFVDDLSGAPGGEYNYAVVAVRRGATPSEADDLFSPASNFVGVRMRSNSTTTTTTAGTGGSGGSGSGSTGGATAGTTRAGPTISRTGRANLSRFEAGLPQRQRIFIPGDPGDPGFDPNLPFDRNPDTEADSAEDVPADQAAIIRERPATATEDSRAALLFVAAGLLATVLLMHLLWLKGEVEKVPLETVAPGVD